MIKIGSILMRWHLLAHAGEASKAPPAICWIGCANTSRRSCSSWKTSAWILITIWRSAICAWSRVQQKVSGCFRSMTGSEAFARIRGYVSTLRKQGVPLLSARPRHSWWSSHPSFTLANLGRYQKLVFTTPYLVEVTAHICTVWSQLPEAM
jgi:hypothetical protein